MCDFNHHRNVYKANVLLLCYLALYLKNIYNTALILLQIKALGIWNSLMLTSEFPKMWHHVRVWKSGHI